MKNYQFLFETFMGMSFCWDDFKFFFSFLNIVKVQ